MNIDLSKNVDPRDIDIRELESQATQDPDAMYLMSVFLTNGYNLVTIDYNMARQYLQKGANKGHALCQMALGIKMAKSSRYDGMYWRGDSLVSLTFFQDTSGVELAYKSRPAIQQKAEQGNPYAQYSLSVFHLNYLGYAYRLMAKRVYTTKHENTTWIKYIKNEFLGLWLDIRDGSECTNSVEADKKVWPLLTQASQQKHADSMNLLGGLYINAPMSRFHIYGWQTGYELYHEAAMLGHAGAQLNTGICHYQISRGNLGEASEWWEKAAQQGCLRANLYLSPNRPEIRCLQQDVEGDWHAVYDPCHFPSHGTISTKVFAP